MGRAVIVEDGIESYGSALAAKKELIVGLIFGQEISAQKSCVIHMARTPEPIPEEEEAQEESQNKKQGSEKKPLEDFDDELVLDHARQVTTYFIIDPVLYENNVYLTGTEGLTWRYYNTGSFYCP